MSLASDDFFVRCQRQTSPTFIFAPATCWAGGAAARLYWIQLPGGRQNPQIYFTATRRVNSCNYLTVRFLIYFYRFCSVVVCCNKRDCHKMVVTCGQGCLRTYCRHGRRLATITLSDCQTFWMNTVVVEYKRISVTDECSLHVLILTSRLLATLTKAVSLMFYHDLWILQLHRRLYFDGAFLSHWPLLWPRRLLMEV